MPAYDVAVSLTSPPLNTDIKIGGLRPSFELPEITANVSPAASILRATEISARPDRHELSARPKIVYNQLSLPCCVSCAMTSAMESLATISPVLSPIFHYHMTRFDNHKAEADGSLLMEDGLDTLRFQGSYRNVLHKKVFTEDDAAGLSNQATEL